MLFATQFTEAAAVRGTTQAKSMPTTTWVADSTRVAPGNTTHSVVNQANMVGSLSATPEKMVSHTGKRFVKYNAPFS